MQEFRDKAVIVTGGAKGIGRGICLAFAREGAKVICADVDAPAGEQVVGEAIGLPGAVRFHRADVAHCNPCQEVVARTVKEFGGVDILVNNVGIQPTEAYLRAHEFPEEMWDRILDVNLKSHFLMSKYCIPEMQIRGGGAIINIASVQGLQSAPRVPAYAASKGGVLSLTRQLALDYAPDRIRVLAICPGSIDTPMLREAVDSSDQDLRTALAQMRQQHPIGRIGTPEDIAQAVLFLASERASFMTGEYVCVDGGMMAKGAWA
jgi:NAD(P)-dependent dehydrogenase (short-subunit alcohol dehydrogenase family)